MGKLITYLTAVEANSAIWIVPKARAEHIKAIAWLNESTSTDFYLIKLEIIKIGDSPPVPLFTIIVEPSEEAREIGQTKKELDEKWWRVQRKKYWTRLLKYASKRTKLHSNITPKKGASIGSGTGISGIRYLYTIAKNEAKVRLYIDRGNQNVNKNIFKELYSQKEDLENIFGEELSWYNPEGERNYQIVKNMSIGGYSDEENWDVVIEKQVNSMIKLEKALRNPIQNLESV